ncbi:condensation domain-containing protein [Actinoallomurus acanthiterrae]
MGGLIFTERRYAEFAGERAVEAPLTLGQINTLDWLGDDTRAGMYRMMEWAVTVPAGTTLDDVADTLAVLVERHESLRTSFVTGDRPRQCVSGSGQVPIDVYETEAAAGSPVAPEEITDLIAGLQSTAVDDVGDPSLRAAVAVRDGVIRLVLIACSHLAADCESLAVVVRQFNRLIRHPAERRAGPRTHQPADQAAVEHSPRGRRRAEASLRYWRRHLTRMPQGVYAMPRPADGDEREIRLDYAVPADPGQGRPLGCWLDSPALRLALPHIAARTQTTLPMVLAAAFCAVLAWRTANPDLVFASLANNRIGTETHDYVGTLAQDSLLAVDADTTSFDELTRRAGGATLRAAMHGLYDVGLRWALQSEIGHRRGVMFQRDCACNITIFGDEARPAGPPEEVQAALARTALRWHIPPYFRVLLLLRVIDSDGEPLLGLTTGHADLVPAAEIESLLLGIDRLLAAAAVGDVDLRRMTELTGLTPIARGPEWQRVDGCWIELPAVQGLVDEAVRAPARVFALPDDDGRPTLTAYIAAGGSVRTPHEAHRACMSLLLGRYTAMTPGRYVICAEAPRDPDDPAAWRRQTVLAEGDGREERR